jgi:hypothetical protein
MLRAMRRGLEAGLRRLLHGHEEGNLGQGAAYGLPRQVPTGLDAVVVEDRFDRVARDVVSEAL